MNYSKLGQVRATAWCRNAFGNEVVDSLHERAARILEESAELNQAEGVSLEYALNIVRQVYARPVGEPAQELAGVMVTTAVYAEVKHLSREDLELMEIVRIENMLAADPHRFRIRHAEKAKLGMSMGADLSQVPASQIPAELMACCEKGEPGGGLCMDCEAFSNAVSMGFDEPPAEPRMLGPRIEGFAPSPGTGLEPHKRALMPDTRAVLDASAITPEEREQLRQQFEGLDTGEAQIVELGAAHSPSDTPEPPDPPQEPAHGSETAPEPDVGVGQGEIVDPGASQEVAKIPRPAQSRVAGAPYDHLANMPDDDYAALTAGFQKWARSRELDLSWSISKGYLDTETSIAHKAWIHSFITYSIQARL